MHQVRNTHEMQIKIAVVRWIAENYSMEKVKVMVNEFTANKSSVRADIMLIVEDEIIGIEIKSGKDNLSRLPNQISYMKKIFNRVIVFVSENHKNSALKICKDESVGLNVVKDDVIIKKYRGRKRRIDKNHLKNTLFSRKFKLRKSFIPNEENYRSFLISKYEETQGIIRELQASSRNASWIEIRSLNPNFTKSNIKEIKRNMYIEDIKKNMIEHQSTQSSSNELLDSSSP